MISVIQVYQQHKEEIEKFLLDNIDNSNLLTIEDKALERFFETFKSLKTLYVTNQNFKQITAKFVRGSKNSNLIGKDRSFLLKKMKLNHNGYYISSPYICTVTGESVITVVTQNNNNLIVMDFNLIDLLEELGYITHGVFFQKLNKYVYALIGYGLSFLAIILIFYSILTFYTYMISYEGTLLESTFKSIVALTLGLAIFDLGKNLLEHEVVYRDNHINNANSSEMFIKFLISIIIAMSIEALLFVFKVALSQQYSNIIYAIYLIGGIAVMIISLAVFYKFSKQQNNHADK